MSATKQDLPVSSEGDRSSGKAVVELRIHGVGGSTPEALLGVASAADTVRVVGGPISAFWARRDEPDVEGLVWGGLTTQSTFQPFWLLLLPFTLLNIAGFMHRGYHDDRRVTVQRRVLRLLGYVLSAMWALWTATIVIEQLAWRLLGLSAVSRVVGGAAGCLVLLAVGLAVARHTTREFDRVAPPLEVRREVTKKGSRYLLKDPAFFFSATDPTQEKVPRVSWWRTWTGQEALGHTLVAVAVIVGAAVRAGSRVRGGDVSPVDPLGIGALLVPALALALVLLAVLAVASAWETVQWFPVLTHHEGPRRWLGPFGAATLAVGLTQLSFGGVAVFVGNLLGLNAAARPEQAIADVVGLAILAAVVGAGILVVGHYPPWPWPWPRKVDWEDPEDPPASPLTGLPSLRWAKRVLRARRLALATARIGWVLAPPSVAVFAFGVLKLWPRQGARFATWGDLAIGWLAPVPCRGGRVGATLDWLSTACGGPGVAPTWLSAAGAWIIGLVLVAGPFGLYRAARSPKVRALAGTLWDVLTFWPRWHHPFAIRSYAERVVPEIQHRIVHHVVVRAADGTAESYRPLVLSVHSQGTVLAFAALASLPTEIAEQVRVVSFGSPLSTLYARFYPAYFDDLGESVGRWVNFYRLTDYVGQEVDGMAKQQVLPDPYEDGSPASLSSRLDEVPLLPWTRINGHSLYRCEPAVRAAVAAARSGAGCPTE